MTLYRLMLTVLLVVTTAVIFGGRARADFHVAAVQCDGAHNRVLIRFGMNGGYYSEIPAGLAADWKNIPDVEDQQECRFANGQTVKISVSASQYAPTEGGGDLYGYFKLTIDDHVVFDDKEFYKGHGISIYTVSAVEYDGKSLIECNPHEVIDPATEARHAAPECRDVSYRLAPGNHLNNQEWGRLHPPHVVYGFGWDHRLYHCSPADGVDGVICATPVLRARLAVLAERYEGLLQSQAPDVAYLAFRDRAFYFPARLRRCNRRSGTLVADEIGCLKRAIDGQIEALKAPSIKGLLLQQIAGSGRLDAGLVERFPKIFLGRTFDFGGSADLRPARTTGVLDGSFTDIDNGKVYEMRTHSTGAPVDIFFAFLKGRFVERYGRLIFVDTDSQVP
ncbi:MAG: hypothetical protein HIU90_14235 [Proteobacteria bacterium]|nr:hypothetical protein [Pseudomonadota bacterium]